ncbi:hypothetical protein HHL11_15855 [Ramlibacter sp. G-1-2-2]|uniref:DUF4434 domain-containing protein n=1 Tax=Ramlibacter agri TaxID=2728837 RepID=A0A848H6T9_9BURK|nr:DUF4434 domain-containing protein [Ramlibacter agri]NML45229.1 hypothetical protein [Ramlibacter agri]
MRRFLPGLLAAAALLAGCATTVPPIEGVVWQIDNDSTQPQGDWDKLGVHSLLVQWTVVDGQAFVNGTPLPAGAKQPDWRKIAAQPWAQEVIVGLAGRFDERGARSDIEGLVKLSAQVAKTPPPVHVAGWYFPIEIDPTWTEAAKLGPLLQQLPRPLWISVYDSANVGPNELADSLAGWLPSDVGVFFQDGVGVQAREPYVAVDYIKALQRRLGKERVRVIAEAFRPQVGGGFRPATLDELRPQLATYAGYPIYLFEGPRYVSPRLVQDLAALQQRR